MKKCLLAAILCALLMLFIAIFVSGANESVVYVNGSLSAGGDGKTPEGAYLTLQEAVAASPEGGTVVICGPTAISGSPKLTATNGAISITSVYGGVDWREINSAELTMNSTFYLGGETAIDSLTIKNGKSSSYNIVARGNKLTVGSDVKTLPYAEDGIIYPSIIGGDYSTACSKGSNVTVYGGDWRNIYGGSYNGSFTGNSEINFLGGTVHLTISGGSFNGAYTGNSTLNIGGEALVKYNTVSNTALGVIGAEVGVSNGTARAFTGDVYINIFGNAQIDANIYAATVFSNVTVNGNITVDIYGNAKINRHVYGAGRSGGVNQSEDGSGITIKIRENAVCGTGGVRSYIHGASNTGTVNSDASVIISDNAYINGNVYLGGHLNTSHLNGNTSLIVKDTATVTVNASPGPKAGTMTGNASAELLGGKIGYLTGSSTLYGVPSAGDGGSVSGTASISVDGADIAGVCSVSSSTDGAVTLKRGYVNGTEGTTHIDLSSGGTLKLGSSIAAQTLTGGGTLSLGAASTLTATEMKGDVELIIEGTPISQNTYISITDTSFNGKVLYTPQSDEILQKTVDEEGVRYTMTYPERFESTKITITYYNPDLTSDIQPKIVIYSYGTEANVKITEGIAYGTTDDGKSTAEVSLTPGIYYYKVYYGNGSTYYLTKYFIVSGKEAEHSYELALDEYTENNWQEKASAITTDEVVDKYYGTDDIEGYTQPNTPTFTKHTGEQDFMTNSELCEYSEALAASSEYLHIYYPFELSELGNRTPVLLYTRDDISDAETLSDAAELIRNRGAREIIMITGGVHGNEPAGSEGVLYFAHMLCSDYGESLDSIGAIVIIPSTQPDNAQRFVREVDGHNPNRDLISHYEQSSANQVEVYNLFMPTVYIDCHEDGNGISIDRADNSIDRITDLYVLYSTPFNSPLIDTEGILDGTFSIKDALGHTISYEIMDAIAEIGLRTDNYKWQYVHPGISENYASVRGSYGFLLEVPRINGGKMGYSRRVYSMTAGIQAAVNAVNERDGELAENVKEARNAAAVSTYDEDRIFVTKSTVSGNTTIVRSHTVVYADGTIKTTEAETPRALYDTVASYKSLPTAYVLPKDTENIASILATLDAHNIKYYELISGASLALRKYTIASTVSLGDEAQITFPDGAYIIPTDCLDAYLIAYMLEPDSYSTTECAVSFVQMGYISETDSLYRCEQSNIKDLIKDSIYSVFGDIDGDGVLANNDITLLIHHLSGWDVGHKIADLNSDGKINNRDVIALIKEATKN